MFGATWVIEVSREGEDFRFVMSCLGLALESGMLSLRLNKSLSESLAPHNGRNGEITGSEAELM